MVGRTTSGYAKSINARRWIEKVYELRATASIDWIKTLGAASLCVV